jgi:CRP-like cAMP-binding protein
MIVIMSGAVEALWDEEARERSLAAGEVLFRAGDPVRSLYRVETGAMRLVRPLPHAAELVIQQARAGAILAEASLFAAAYHCDAVASAPTRVRAVPVARITGLWSAILPWRRPLLAIWRWRSKGREHERRSHRSRP